MRPNKFSIDQIIKIIAEAELPGSSVSSVARKYGVNPNTIYRWRQKYKGMSASEAKRLKALEEENSRLKRLLAEKELPIHPRSRHLLSLLKKISEQAGGKSAYTSTAYSV